MADRSRRSQTPSDQGGTPHPYLPPTPERDNFSIIDLLQHQQEHETEAAKVLPFNFKQCTNPIGPGIKQPIYACLTCHANNKEQELNGNEDNNEEGEDIERGLVGVCSACSIQCHGDHHLVELFSKRNFTCDCGTTRIKKANSTTSSFKCQLSNRQDCKPSNQNRYDDTYLGIFCICEKGKIYNPDTEDEDMYQCVVCEDWRHAGCLGPHPHPDDWDTMICERCILNSQSVRTLVRRWAGFNGSGIMICVGDGEENIHGRLLGKKSDGLATVIEEENVPTSSQVEKEVEKEDEEEEVQPTNTESNPVSSSPQQYYGPVSLKRKNQTSSSPKKKSRLDQSPPNKSICTAPLPSHQSSELIRRATPHANIYLAQGWKDRWCLCSNGCRAMFDELPFLVEEEEEWEAEEDEDSKKSLFELGMKALSDMPRDQAMDGMIAYQKLRDKMMAFLKPFADAGEIVTRDAVEEFFQREKEAAKASLES